jgi:glycosyltransferase involved in cell wall biosynthesis
VSESSGRAQGAVFVNQVSRTGVIGPIASWITLAGWAGAAEARYGQAWMVTPEGVLTPGEALGLASRSTRSGSSVPAWRRRIPEAIPTAVKDLRRIRENRSFRRHLDVAPWLSTSVRFVMQLHELGCDGGIRLADALSVPSVLLVDACQVEEARSWGVRRPGWTTVAEYLGERPQLRRADVVVCVSAEVAASVARCAGRTEGVVVVPNGVDTARFAPGPADPELSARLGLDDRFVIGWSGSFRAFHALDVLVEAAELARRVTPNLSLLLVGDGLERPAVERRAAELGVPGAFPGTVGYDQMPEYLRLMDVAVVLAPGRGSFHYSPVKLREYQACGRPIVAAASGEMGRSLHDSDDALLVPAGDSAALADAIVRLARDPAAAARLGNRARDTVVASGSWASRLELLEQNLGEIMARRAF